MTTTNDKTTDREAWLAERLTGIGASEAPAILGVSGFKSPVEVAAEKLGRIEPEDLSDNEAVEFGLRLEGVIVEAFSARTGRSCSLWPRHQIARHRTLPWMICTPDAEQSALAEEVEAFSWMAGQGNLQIKTTSAWNAKEWADGPPLAYQVQVQHELEVLGREWGTLVVLIGGQKLRWFDVRRNQPFIDAMVETLDEFWSALQRGELPPVDGSESCSRALAKLHPGDTGGEIALPPEALEWDREFQDVKKQIKALEARESLLKNQFVAAIGDNSIGYLPGGAAYSYKAQTRKEYVVKENTFRVLRRSK